MANLKSGTLIGGNLIWHQGNLEFKTTDDHLYFKDKEVYHEGHTPTPAEVGAVNKAGDTMNGPLITTSKITISGANTSGREFEALNGSERVVIRHSDGKALLGHASSGTEWTGFIRIGKGTFEFNNGSVSYGVYHRGDKPTWNDVEGDTYFQKQDVDHIKVQNRHLMAGSPSHGFFPSNSGSGSSSKSYLGNSGWWFKEAWVNTYRGGSMNITGPIYSNGSMNSNAYNARNGSRLISFADDKILRIGNSSGQETHTRVHGTGGAHSLSVWNPTTNKDEWVYHEGHKPTPAEIGAQSSLTTPFSTRDYRASATVQPELKDAANRSLIANSSYFVRLATTSTGTPTGAVYVVTITTAGVPHVQLIANKGTGSNHPELIIKENKVHIKTTHANEYNIRVFMQEAGTSSPNNMFVAETEYFSKFHKPDVSEVINAVNKTGDTMTGVLNVSGYSNDGPSQWRRNIYLSSDGHQAINGRKAGLGFHDTSGDPKGSIFFWNNSTDGKGGTYVAILNSTGLTIQGDGRVTTNGVDSRSPFKLTSSGTSNTLIQMPNVPVNGVAYINWVSGQNVMSFTKSAAENSSKVNIHGHLCELGQRAYTPNNKPTWEDVGGNEFFTMDKTNKYIHTAHDYWNMASSDERGWMPNSSGNHGTSKSFLGNSDWWFKEAWVNTYRGSNIDVDGSVKVRNGAPTISLINTGNKSAFIHAESDRFYVLRSSGNGGDGWDSGPGGRHPMVLDLNTGDAHFSRSVRGNYSESNAYASQYSTSAPFYHDYSTASTSAYFPMIKQRGVHSSGPEDWATSIGQLVGSTGVVETSLQMIKSDSTAKNWRFMTNGGFSSPGNIYENGDDRVYSTGNKPTVSDIAGAVNKVGDTMTGKLVANGSIDSVGLRIKRSDASTTGDDVVDFTVDDAGLNIIIDNDNDADSSLFRVGFKSNGVDHELLNVQNHQFKYKNGDVYHVNNKPTPEDVGAVPILELGAIHDYQQAVVLLHKISGGASDFRYFAGTISFGRGNGLYEPFSYEINTTKQYNQIAPFGRAVSMGAYSSENYLCTCSYNGETYIALRIAHSDAQVSRIDVSGSWSDTPVKVPYYTKANGSNPEVVNNADINGSIRKWKDAEQVTVASVMQALFPVGHILHTTNPNNPTTYGYPGTWQLLPNEIFLQSTHTASSLGQTTGTNAPGVPVPQHNHGASIGGTTLNKRFTTNTTGNHAHSGSTNTTGNHAHSGSTNSAGNHTHNVRTGWWTNGAPSYIAKSEKSHNQNQATDAAGAHTHSISTNTTGNHAHSFSTNTTGNHNHFTDVNFGSHGHSVSVHNNGTPGATLDVRGYRMWIYMWRRTA